MSDNDTDTDTPGAILVGAIRAPYMQGTPVRWHDGWANILVEPPEEAGDGWWASLHSTEHRCTTAAEAQREAFDGDYIGSADTREEAVRLAETFLSDGGTVVCRRCGEISPEAETIADAGAWVHPYCKPVSPRTDRRAVVDPLCVASLTAYPDDVTWVHAATWYDPSVGWCASLDNAETADPATIFDGAFYSEGHPSELAAVAWAVQLLQSYTLAEGVDR